MTPMRSPTGNAKTRGRARAERPESRPLPTDPEAAIDTNQLGVLLQLAPITLAQGRALGKDHPPFFRIGRAIRYRLGDVIAWRDAKKVGRRSTTQEGSPAA